MSGSLIAFFFCFTLAAIGPAPSKAPPGERVLYVALLCAGMATYVAAAVMPMIGMWMQGAIAGITATTLIMLCMWLARSPIRREQRARNEQEDSGEGGTKIPRSEPDPPKPQGDFKPEGPVPDWTQFDDARAGWEQPAADRELVGV